MHSIYKCQINIYFIGIEKKLWAAIGANKGIVTGSVSDPEPGELAAQAWL
jgi:hypothetical protein